MSSIITTLVDDAEGAIAALAAFAPKPAATATSPAAPSIITSVEAQIDAVTFSQGMSALASIATSASSGAASLPAGALVAAEDFAGLVDPSLIPLIAAVRMILPYVQLGVGFLADGAGAVNMHPVGQAGSKPIGIA